MKVLNTINKLVIIFAITVCSNGATGQVVPTESVWLQMAKDIYLPGETIIFRASVVDRETYLSSNTSNVIRIELLDNEGNTISRQTQTLINSKVNGSLKLPESLPTGWYYIRSYTNWMRNFSEDYFSLFPIKILNHKDLMNNSLVDNRSDLRAKLIRHGSQNKTIDSNHSIYVSNSCNEPVESNGYASGILGDTLFNFETDKSGWGLVNYEHNIDDDVSIHIPGCERVSMEFTSSTSLSKTSQQNINIDKEHGYLTLEIENPDQGIEYKLLVHKEYTWSWYDRQYSEKESIIFRIPLRLIPSGISQLSLYGNNNDLLFSRLWADYNKEIGNIEIEILDNHSESDSELIFDYLLAGDFRNEGETQMNVLVDKSIIESRIHNFIPGLPGWGTNYEIPQNHNAFEAWLCVNTYPDTVALSFLKPGDIEPRSSELLDPPIWDQKYLPEVEGLILQGRVVDNDNEKGIGNVYLGVTFLNSEGFFTTVTDSSGRFEYSFPGIYGRQDYILNFISASKDSWGIMTEKSFHEVKGQRKNTSISFTENEFTFLREQNLTSQLLQIYAANNLEIREDETVSNPISILPFYGRSEFKICPDDYIDLPSINELIYEVIPSISVKHSVDGLPFLQVNSINEQDSPFPPLVLVDGIAFNDIRELLNISPELIDTIDVITGRFVHNEIVFSGMVSFRTKERDLGGLQISGETILSSIQMPLLSTGSENLNINNSSLGTPYLINTLIWESTNSRFSGRINFRRNDNPGEFFISIYGYGSDGRWHSGLKYFRSNFE